MLDLRSTLIGTLGAAAAGSACGNPVDTMGFADVLVVAQIACAGGTDANQGYLSVRFQECAIEGTGANYTDITDAVGGVTGSAKVQFPLGIAATYPQLASTSFTFKVNDGTRARYIRPIASVACTAGIEYVYSISVLLGRPYDSALIQRACIISSSIDEFTKPAM